VERVLGTLGDGHALVASVIAERIDTGLLGNADARVVAHIWGSQVARDEDFVSVEGDRDRSGEPAVGQAARKPGGKFVSCGGWWFGLASSAGSSAATSAAILWWKAHLRLLSSDLPKNRECEST
jgi:hypothetical protein